MTSTFTDCVTRWHWVKQWMNIIDNDCIYIRMSLFINYAIISSLAHFGLPGQKTAIYYFGILRFADNQLFAGQWSFFEVNAANRVKKEKLLDGPLARYANVRRECREHFPHHHWLAIPACITARAWHTCCDAFRDRKLAVSFEISGGENVSDIPGQCATRNFTYLVRGPLLEACRKH